MYTVIKKIGGHEYYYEQQTYRVGETVKTVNRYIGPVGDTESKPGEQINTTRQGVEDALDFIYLGPLPVGAIRRVFGRRIKPGVIGFHREGQEHAVDRHANDYGAVSEAIKTGAATPVYIGQSPRHRNAIEIYYIHDGIYYLLAVSLKIDYNGIYRASTLFEVSKTKIKSRFSSGRLHDLFW